MGVVGEDGGEREQPGAGGGGQCGRSKPQGQRGHRESQALQLGQVLHLQLLLRQTKRKIKSQKIDKTQ